MRHTTRRTAWGVMAAGLVLLVSACGGSSGSSGTAKPDAAPASVAASPATRTVQSDKGPVEVPAQPKRVVSLLNSTAVLLELGVVPVGVLQEFEADYAPEDWTVLSKIPVVGQNESSINYEQLIGLQPDLIVSTQRREEDFGYARLSQIAPTVFITTDNPAEVREALPKFADAVGKADVIAGKISEYQAKLSSVKGKYADTLASATFDYVEGGPDGFIANSPVSWPGLFMEAAGLKFSKVADGERANRGVRLSYEQISQLKDTTVILYGVSPDDKTDDATRKLFDQGSWKLLPAVKKGHVHPVKYGYAYSYKGVLSILDQLDAVLAKAAA
ncbi:iron complex transport system substrate-binding protein [Sinosporangium album]|uniref:Iron complex transport system substrate-binding protein n=1 Tax=Sinosporangium album TaxID=504805 RepID=A0A1G8HN13_9ACTN|nr:ABC transporter substrate-binding protein [Sinosporangium album]SDI07861.1 iron complex transport system substrate-binding protein [Sinosporangium album]